MQQLPANPKKMFDIIWKGTENKRKGIILLLFKTFVCPHLESCVRFRSLQLKKYVVELEKVERREAKMIMVMQQLLYEKTLKRLEVFNSEKKSVLEGEIKIYKTIKAVDKVNEEMLFTIPQHRS